MSAITSEMMVQISQNPEIWMFTLSNIFTLILGLVLTTVAYRAYRREGLDAFLIATSGFVFITVGTIIEMVFEFVVNDILRGVLRRSDGNCSSFGQLKGSSLLSGYYCSSTRSNVFNGVDQPQLSAFPAIVISLITPDRPSQVPDESAHRTPRSPRRSCHAGPSPV